MIRSLLSVLAGIAALTTDQDVDVCLRVNPGCRLAIRRGSHAAGWEILQADLTIMPSEAGYQLGEI
jgi:hypothetical protein